MGLSNGTKASSFRITQRPDDEARDGDHGDRPDRIVGQGTEVGDDEEARDADAEDAGPGRRHEQAEADGEGEYAQGEVDPSPGGEVELEDVVPRRDEYVVVRDLRDAAHDVENAADHEHDGREDGYAGGPFPQGRAEASRVRGGHAGLVVPLLVR